MEASLFASDLFKMYEKLATKMVVGVNKHPKSDAGDLRGYASIKGENIYSCLKFEIDFIVQRVQKPKLKVSSRFSRYRSSIT